MTAISYGWIGAAAVLSLGLAGAVLFSAPGRVRERVPGRMRAARTREEAKPLPSDAERLSRDRERLVDECIAAFDAIDSKAIRSDLPHTLDHAGVTAVEAPTNTCSDPAEHKAADTELTGRQAPDGLVSGTERLWFVDRGRRRRWLDGLVFRFVDVEHAGRGGM